MSNPTVSLSSSTDVAKLLDHALLQPVLTTAEMRAELEGLRVHPIASVCIKPYAVPLAVEVLAGTPIEVGTVIGFPHGSLRADVKAYETEKAYDDGCTEVDMVVNIGLVKSEDWAGVREDISAVLEVSNRRNGLLKVIFETDFVTEEHLKIRLCEICTELGVGFVKTSTGFGFVKGEDGKFAAKGAQIADLELMRKHCAPSVGVKASGGVRSLDDLLKAVAAGANRIGTTSTHAILAAAKEKFGA